MLPSFTASVLLYMATRDGFQASAFHARCDNVANTVIVIGNNFNYVFGGFTAARWTNTDGWIDPTAFIFSLRRNGITLHITSTLVNRALYGWSYISHGPIFGNGKDIFICDKSNITTGSYSYIHAFTPPTYPSGSDVSTFLSGGMYNWLATEIEVYQLS